MLARLLDRLEELLRLPGQVNEGLVRLAYWQGVKETAILALALLALAVAWRKR